MHLVWHADNLWEEDWIRFVFRDHVDAETVDLDDACFIDDSIHVVSGNYRPLIKYRRYFEELRSRCSRIALFHASDEWFSGHYACYRWFDLVFRNFWFRLTVHPGIWTVPFGYPNDTELGRENVRASERPWSWSFVGHVKTSRKNMIDTLSRVEGHRLLDTKGFGFTPGSLAKPDYDAILAQSMFAPCPMGNAILETWRFYEALELGCIPLVERRPNLDYYREILGSNPVPTFVDWREAASFVGSVRADARALDALQSTIAQWWASKKVEIQQRATEALLGPSRRNELAAFADQPVICNRLLFEAARLPELVKHQSPASLVTRLLHVGGPARRVFRELRDSMTG